MKKYLFAVTVPDESTRTQVETALKTGLDLGGVRPRDLLLVEAGEFSLAFNSQPWCFVSIKNQDDSYKREFQIAQCALSDARHEHSITRYILRTVTADRDRLLGELQSARESLSARRLTIAHEVGSEAFDDMRELRTHAKRCKETHAALVKIYGDGSNSEWGKAIDDHQSAMLALQLLREKLGT